METPSFSSFHHFHSRGNPHSPLFSEILTAQISSLLESGSEIIELVSVETVVSLGSAYISQTFNGCCNSRVTFS